MASKTSRTLIQHFDALDAALVRAGWPATSRWWRDTLEEFFDSGRRQLVLRVGRRGGKSTTLCRVGLVEALYGTHVINPGDVGIVGVVSVSRDEAVQRLRTIKAILDVLKVAYRPIDGGVELTLRPIVFKVFTASISGVVGGTWISAICDEVARWRDADTGANPASEVLASLRPTMATMPSAKLFLSSSPLGNLDAHAVAFDQGDTDHQRVAFAETWTANPSISELETHELEPTDRIWRREYAAQPQGQLSACFDIEDINEAMVRVLPPGYTASPWVLAIDASRGGGGDSWTWCLARWCPPPARSELPALLQVPLIGEVPRVFTTDQAVEYLCGIAWSQGVRTIIGDQFEAGALSVLFGKAGFTFREMTWGQKSKREAVDRLERWLHDGTILLPAHETLRRQLTEYSEKITKTGSIAYGGRGAHDDYAQAILTLTMADIERLLQGSPVRTSRFAVWDEQTISAQVKAYSARIERAAAKGFSPTQLAAVGIRPKIEPPMHGHVNEKGEVVFEKREPASYTSSNPSPRDSYGSQRGTGRKVLP